MRVWRLIMTAVAASLCFASAGWGEDAPPRDCVALIHGLARSPASFTLTAAYLEQVGFSVITPSYPSTEAGPEQLAEQVWQQVLAGCAEAERFHVVTHSLGGILTRIALRNARPERLGHVVMLAPPNQGSGIVDAFSDQPWFAWLNGPTGVALGTDAQDLPRRLPDARYSLGVIAGSVSFNPIYSALVQGRDDGKVSIDSTKLAGMADHITVPSSHTFIMNSPLTLVHIEHFLRHGRFDHQLGWAEAAVKVSQVGLAQLGDFK